NQTVRNVFVIGPDKKIKLILVYPMTTGRNFDEVIRVIDSLQRTAQHKVATPVNWQPGDEVIIAGSVTNDEAKEIYPEGWKSPKPYIRIVPDPGSREPAGAGSEQPGCGSKPFRRDARGVPARPSPVRRLRRARRASGRAGVGEQARDVPLVERVEDVVGLADDGDLLERVRADDGVG